MKIHRLQRHLFLAFLASAAVLPGRAHAAFTLTLTQVGTSVVVNGSGSINTAGFTANGTGSGFNPQINPSTGVLYSGPTAGNGVFIENGVTGPASFGTGTTTVFATTATGSFVGVEAAPDATPFGIGIVVPIGYTSKSALSDTTTFANATFSTLGFTPGTYTYTWGTGANADSLTINSVVPEPSTWTLLGVGATSAGIVALRRRRARA